MSKTLFLSRDELVELTDRQKSDAQIRWLKRNRVPFVTSEDGKPKVLRSVLVARLGGIVENPEPQLRLVNNNK